MMLAALQNIYWREPLWLLLGIQPLLLIMMRKLFNRNRLSKYASLHLQPWVISSKHQSILQRLLSRDSAYILAWLLIAAAVAGPRSPLSTEGLNLRPGSDIMIVVDISRSMSVADVLPNRLRRASLEIKELLGHTRGDRLGLIVYGAHAHVFVPITSDLEVIDYYLRFMHKLIAPTRGSNLVEALELARDKLAGSSRDTSIILMTDGDLDNNDIQQSSLNKIADQLKKQGTPLYIIGMASLEGDAITLPGGGWLQYNGRPVISVMDEDLLQGLASKTGGGFSRVQDDNSEWIDIYDNGIARQSRSIPADEGADKVSWIEHYPWLLFPGILLLFISLNPYRVCLTIAQSGTHALLMIILVPILLSAHVDAYAGNVDPATERKAYQAYLDGNYPRASSLYEQIDAYVGRFGEAASQYRMGNYRRAVQHFSVAVMMAETDQQRAAALYNLGNSQFKLGDYAGAIRIYKDVLIYRPGHKGTLTNLRFSQALLKEIAIRQSYSGKTTRMGAGPHSALADGAVDVNDGGSVSIDDSEDKGSDDDTPIEATLADLNEQQLAALIQQGLDHIRLAAGNQPDIRRDKGRQRQLSLPAAKRLMAQMSDDQPRLWKRLFELEEGYPAPLSRPETIPGVIPW